MPKIETAFMPFLLIILLLRTSISFCDTTTVDSLKNPLQFNSSGIFGGKLNGASFGSGEPMLRNHGYFYSCSNIRYSFRDLAVIKTRLRVWNKDWMLPSIRNWDSVFFPRTALFLKHGRFGI
jgi:hypothetical protein